MRFLFTVNDMYIFVRTKKYEAEKDIGILQEGWYIQNGRTSVRVRSAHVLLMQFQFNMADSKQYHEY